MRLLEPDLTDPAAVVGHLLAVQGQEFHPALWGISRRVDPSRRPDVKASVVAFDAGELLRTHVLRPTWHLVLPRDVRWLLELTGSRVRRLMGTVLRSLGASDPERALDAVARLVRDGPLTRGEIVSGLIGRGLLAAEPNGVEVAQILITAELRQAVISGPMSGRQHTYAAFDSRVPAGYGPVGERFDRDVALVELWRGYLRGRACATVKDLAQWSGLTMADARRGLNLLLDADGPEAVQQVAGTGDLDGLTFLTLPEARRDRPVPRSPQPPVIDLLQPYDEYVIAFGESRSVVYPPAADRQPGARNGLLPGVAVDGVIAGWWRWTAGPRTLAFRAEWHRQPTSTETAGLEEQALLAAAYWRLELGRRS